MEIGEGACILIQSVVPDYPAAKAGLGTGDEMLKIGDRPLKTITPEQLTAFSQPARQINIKRPGSITFYHTKSAQNSHLKPSHVILVNQPKSTRSK
ncbi:MAG TPA: PDZ domain-containing protein [Verrucomicrobiales bacterium]|nr:PDZ domain-containing protein [Verrucomicrobiales bacterium]HIL69407.1 PDZ domain-containing protein [Verrucomicrobiota bacterium]